MTSFNSNLNNLFKNYQQQEQYKKKTFDVNGDGKVNANDKTALTNKEKEIKKQKNLFDVNGDGKFNQADVDMFVKGDVNGDGKITQEELNFISKYKKDFMDDVNDKKITFTLDGIIYSNGDKAKGLVNGLYYKNGVLFTGKVSGKTYVYGNEIAKDSTYAIDSNKMATVTSKDGKTVIKYNPDGTKKYEVFDNNGTSLPSIVNDKIKFANSKQIEIPKGARLYIGQDGSVGVFTDNEKHRVCYDKNGNVLSTTINNNPKGEPSMQYNGWVKFEGDANARMGFSKGEKVVINEDKTVTVTSKDGTVKLYDKRGVQVDKPIFISGQIVFRTGEKVTLPTVDYKLDMDESGNVQIIQKDGKTVTKYDITGNKKYEVFDNNGTSLPSVVNDKIKFANNKETEIPKGARLYIGQDGSVGLFSNNEKERLCFNKNGDLLSTTINNNPSGQPSMLYNGWVQFEGGVKLEFAKGQTVTINADKTVTVTEKDGKTVTYYDKTGKITTKPEPISSPKPPVTIPSPVRTYDYSTPGIVDCGLNTSLARNGKSKSLSIDNEGNLINKYEGASYTYKFVPGPKNIDPKSIISVAWNEGGLGTSFITTKTQEQVIDENGNPKIDKNGNPVYADVFKKYVFTQERDPDKKKEFEVHTDNYAVLEYNDYKSYQNDLPSKKIIQPSGKVIDFCNKNGVNYLSYMDKDSPYYLKYVQNSELNNNIKADIDIVIEAENLGEKGSAAYNNYIKSKMISTPNNMKNVVGEIVEKTDGLYVNDGNKLVKLGISAETYLKLFPPVERYDIQQRNIGDCNFISSILISGMRNPNTFAKLIQMFSEDSNGNLTIAFTGEKSNPVTFNNMELREIDGKGKGGKAVKSGIIMWRNRGKNEENNQALLQLKGSLGLQMLEQAYAIAISSKSTTDIDDALKGIFGKNAKTAIGKVLGTSVGSSCVSGAAGDIAGFLDKYADRLNSGEIILTFESLYNPDNQNGDSAYKKYRLEPSHAYSITKIDKDKKLVYVSNSECGGAIVEMPYSVLAKAAAPYIDYEQLKKDAKKNGAPFVPDLSDIPAAGLHYTLYTL